MIKKILIVDDDEDLRNLCIALLGEVYAIIEARDAADALEKNEQISI